MVKFAKYAVKNFFQFIGASAIALKIARELDRIETKKSIILLNQYVMLKAIRYRVSLVRSRIVDYLPDLTKVTGQKRMNNICGMCRKDINKLTNRKFCSICKKEIEDIKKTIQNIQFIDKNKYQDDWIEAVRIAQYKTKKYKQRLGLNNCTNPDNCFFCDKKDCLL